MKVYHDIETLFESWKKRKLTLYGKCSVINSLALAKLIYTASILESPDGEFIKKINRLVLNFIWNKTDRIKRNTIIGHIKDGGLGVTDVEAKIKALKATWVFRLKESNHCIKSYVNSFCIPNNIDLDYLILTTDYRIQNNEIISKMPLFYKQVFACFNTCKEIQGNPSTVSLLKEPIWSNMRFLHKGKSIFFPNWSKSNILFVKDLFSAKGILKSPDEIIRILENKSNWICEYKIIRAIFKKYEKQYDFSLNIYVKENSQNSRNRDTFTTKYFYDILLKKKFTTPAIQIKYTKEFNLSKQDWENIYMNKIYRIKDKKIAEFNYKLINNILSNNYFVSKIEKNSAFLCKGCPQVENTRHLIFECKNVKNLWKNISNYIGFEVKWKHVLFGFYSVQNDTTYLYNLLLSFVALKIYKYKMYCRLEKNIISYEGILFHLKSC